MKSTINQRDTKNQRDTNQNSQSQALGILMREVDGWGSGRAKYPISPEDMTVLLEGGAIPLMQNHDNGDGTFLTEVTFQGHAFMTSSKQLL